MFLQKVIFLAVLALSPIIAAHPSHSNEHRDLENIYYGPDTNQIKFRPVPKGSAALPVNPKTGYYLEHLGAGTYFITEGAYQAIFLVSDAGVIVVDCPPTIGYKLKSAIKTVTDKPVTHLVYSHAHADHIGGAYIFNDTVREYIAHYKTLQILEELPTLDPLRPLPNVVFREEKVLRVGNQTLELCYKGPNHLDGNIFIYAPAAKTLVLIDVVFPGWLPFAALAQSNDIVGWIRAHDQILKYKFETYVGGHLGRYGNRHDVVLQKQYVTDLYNNCAAAINGGINASQVLGPVSSMNPGNPWAQFKVYLKAAADQCAEKTNEKWLGRLAGVDIFGWENAFKMVEVLRIDYDVLGPAFGVQSPA